jgi:hypothetical protein
MRARTRTRIVPAASTGAAAVAVSERAPSAATTSTLSMPDHGNNTAVVETKREVNSSERQIVKTKKNKQATQTDENPPIDH